MIGKKPTIMELQAVLDEPCGAIEIAPDGSIVGSEFRKGLESLLNQHSKENGSDTPDFVLAEFLIHSLSAFDAATKRRNDWYAPPQSAEDIANMRGELKQKSENQP